MDLNAHRFIQFASWFVMMLLGGLNSRALAICVVGAIAIGHANQVVEYEIIWTAFVLGYFLSNFRE